MAKCIRVVGQGVPVRMSDDDAFQVVERDHDGEYCSKKFWRDWYAPSDTFPGGRIPERAKLAGPKGTTITSVETLARQLQHSNKGGW